MKKKTVKRIGMSFLYATITSALFGSILYHETFISYIVIYIMMASFGIVCIELVSFIWNFKHTEDDINNKPFMNLVCPLCIGIVLAYTTAKRLCNTSNEFALIVMNMLSTYIVLFAIFYLIEKFRDEINKDEK